PAGDAAALLAALDKLGDEEERARRVAVGLKRAQLFDWRDSARAYAETLTDVATRLRAGALAPPSPLWAMLRGEQQRNQDDLAALRARAGGRAKTGLTGVLARSPLRPALFHARGWLLRRLPTSAIPAARRAWRVLMGVRTE